MSTIRSRSIAGTDDDTTFWELFMGIGTAYLLKKFFHDLFLESIESKMELIKSLWRKFWLQNPIRPSTVYGIILGSKWIADEFIQKK